MRQLLAESLLIALVSGAIGIALAAAGTHVLVALNQDNLRHAQLSMDGRVLAFTLAISLLSGVLFGLAPSLQLSSPDLMGSLRDEGRGFSGTRRGNRSRSVLVISQVALSTVLLVGSGLLLRSFMQLRNQSPGFDPGNILTMQITLPHTRYARPDDIVAFYRRALLQVRNLPGVIAASISTALPVVPNHLTPILFEGQPSVALGKRPIINLQQISPDYLKVMRVPLIAGRSFNEHDDAQSPQVAMVNQLTARRFWPNENPLGKRLWLGSLPTSLRGGGSSGRYTKRRSRRRRRSPEVLLPFPQLTVPYLSLSLRTRTNLIVWLRLCGSSCRNRSRPAGYGSQDDGGSDRVLNAGRRFTLFLIGTLSGSAFLLAVVGIYGVIAYSVAQRTQEWEFVWPWARLAATFSGW